MQDTYVSVLKNREDHHRKENYLKLNMNTFDFTGNLVGTNNNSGLSAGTREAALSNQF
jgi:hypothetical protein